MDSIFRALMFSLFLITFLGFAGCAPASKPPEYPSLLDIPTIREYPSSGQSWNTDAVCWIGMTNDAKWSWDLLSTSSGNTQWVRQNTAKIVQQLIREELKSQGYEVKVFADDYLTRQKRLMVKKLIFFEEFDIRKTMIKEGACFDMKLTVKIVNNPDFDQSEQCQVWGRSLVLENETKQWEDIIKDCVRNIRNVPEFRRALELNPVESTFSSGP